MHDEGYSQQNPTGYSINYEFSNRVCRWKTNGNIDCYVTNMAVITQSTIHKKCSLRGSTMVCNHPPYVSVAQHSTHCRCMPRPIVLSCMLLFLALSNNLSHLLLEGWSVISPLNRGIQIGRTFVVGIGKHGND